MPHPSSQELIEFSLGRLPDAASASVESHVSDCRTCCETLLQLKADDTFVELLQEGERLGEQTILLEPGGSRPTSESMPAQLAGHPRYEILERIGKGGMGDVFKARHRKMERTVALKIIRSELVQKPAAVDRFQREVRTAAGLSHPNIVTAYDADQVGDVHFLVMEFVDGVNLDEVVRQRGPLPVRQACDFIRQAAAGLQHAHERGMIHRDIKPHNLMLTATGEVKILDFGLAAFAGDSAADALSNPDAEQTLTPSQLTQMGALMGTPDFMAPEQAQDAHSADIRADIYSLGCTFYNLLVGRAPFGERTLRNKIQAHTAENALPLAKVRDDVPASVEAVLSKMLAKDRTERYQTPAEVVQALIDCTRPSVSSAESSLNRTRLRSRALIGASFALLAALTAAAVYYIQTNHGLVRIEVADESLTVQFNGRTIEMKDGETPLTIRPGEHKLHIRRGNLEFEADHFQLRRGEKTAVTVDVLPGEVVVLKDGRRFFARRLEETPVQPDEITFVRKFEGHTGAIKAAKYSPDGKYIASASGFPKTDGTIRLWDVKSAKEIRQFAGIQGATQSLCFSHDGTRLLTGGSDKLLRLWDVASGELLQTLAGHEGSIECVAFSPDDKIAVSGSVATEGKDHTARSWDLVAGKETARFTGHKLHVHGVAVIDETRAISVDRLGAGYIWRLDNGQLLKRLVVPSTASNSAYSLALSPDRKTAIIGYQDNSIRLWDVNAGEVRQTFATKNSPVMSVCMSGDQRYVFAGGGAMGDTKVAVEVFDVAGGKLVAATKPTDGTTWSIALAPDGRHVVSAGGATWKAEDGFTPNGDYNLYLWKLPDSVLARDVDLGRIVVELKDGGRFTIEGREVTSAELMNRLQWILKETPDREVHVLPARKLCGEPFRQLVNLVQATGGKRVSWPAWVDEELRRELTGVDLDPAVADAVDQLVAVFEKYLRNMKAKSAIVGEFPGGFPERVGAPLKAGVEQKLRDKGFEILPAGASPALVFELSGESYELKPYKGSVKLDVRWRIRSRKGGAPGHQGGSGALTTYGRKQDDTSTETP